MRCVITSPIGLLIIFACVVYSGGFSAGLDFVKKLLSALDEVGKFLFSFAMQFPDELGITDWLWTRGIYASIAVFAAIVAGYAFTAKEKKKLLGIIGSIVSFISTLLTFCH